MISIKFHTKGSGILITPELAEEIWKTHEWQVLKVKNSKEKVIFCISNREVALKFRDCSGNSFWSHNKKIFLQEVIGGYYFGKAKKVNIEIDADNIPSNFLTKIKIEIEDEEKVEEFVDDI